MALKKILANLDDVPAALHDFYKQTDKGYVLDLDDDDDRRKVDEFRANNIELRKKIEEAQAQLDRYKGIDPEKARAAQVKLAELEKKRLVDDGDIAALEKRISEEQREFHEQEKRTLREAALEKEKRIAAQTAKLRGYTLSDAISRAMNALGYQPAPNALPDIMSRAGGYYDLDEKDQLKVAVERPAIDPQTTEPVNTPDQFVAYLVRTAPHLFKAGGGSGARPGDGDTGGNKRIVRGDEATPDDLRALAEGKAVRGKS